MTESFKTFENHFQFRQKHAGWFDASPLQLERFKLLVQRGFTYLLKERDENGAVVCVANTETFDLDKYGTTDAMNCLYLTLTSSLEREENQILGYVYVINYSNTASKYFTNFSISELMDWVKSVNSMPGRYRKIIVIGLPSIANALLNAAKLAMNEKQRGRLLILNHVNELCQFIDAKILPARLGGKQSESDITEHFINAFEQHVDKLRESNKFEIDSVQVMKANEIFASVGSFRKLEID